MVMIIIGNASTQLLVLQEGLPNRTANRYPYYTKGYILSEFNGGPIFIAGTVLYKLGERRLFCRRER